MCPHAWPTHGGAPEAFNHALVCCTDATATMVYDTCGGASDAKKRVHVAQRAIRVLQRHAIAVAGDSSTLEWLNALLLDVIGRTSHSLPEAKAALDRMLEKGKMAHGDSKVGVCDERFDWELRDPDSALPSVSFRETQMNRDDYITRDSGRERKIPTCLRQAEMWGLERLRSREAQRCCEQDPTAPVPAVLIAAMQSAHPPPSVVLVHYGNHWHDRERGNESMRWYEHDVEHLLGNLSLYSTWYSQQKGSGGRRPLLLFRENFPQHFATLEHDGSNENWRLAAARRPEKHSRKCEPIRWWLPTNVGARSLNERASRLVNNVQPVVQWLGGGFEPLAWRYDVHLNGTTSLADCTHHCYSPFLWEPVLDAFYRKVDAWAGSSE